MGMLRSMSPRRTARSGSSARSDAPTALHGEQVSLVDTPDDLVTTLRQLTASGVEEVALLFRDWSESQLALVAHEVMPAFR